MTVENHFGDAIAPIYDETHAERFAPAQLTPTVDLLAELAGEGPALEFGIGTGRVALPLSQRGVAMSGIELSSAMVEQLRAKPGGEDIPVVVGDFASARVNTTFSLVFLVFNTINNLVTQEQQVACFANAAAHLAPGGRFVVEVGVPKLRRLPPGESAVAFAVDEGHIGVDRYTDLTEQRFESHHHYVTESGSHHFSTPFRFVWPSELDLMAQLASMTLVERWEDWHRAPFTGESEQHVSVWQLPG